MLEDVINEFVLFQMYDTRISGLDYTYCVAMPTHTHMHTHASLLNHAQHWGGKKGPKRNIFFVSKEFPIVKSSNIFLNQLEAW